MANAIYLGALTPTMKDDIKIEQASPTSGTQYEVLPFTNHVHIISLTARVTWTVQPTPLEAHVTVDGVVITFSRTNPVSATNYMASLGNSMAPSTAQVFDTSDTAATRDILSGRRVQVTVEITGGTVSLLECRLKYWMLE